VSYHAACKVIDTLTAEGKWPVSLKKPSPTELVDVYVSRSYWYSHISKMFSDISRYPQMVAWLERGDSNDPSDYDVWHQFKTVYTFKELKDWIQNGGTLDLNAKKKLEKGKERKQKQKQKIGKSKPNIEEDIQTKEVVDKKGKKKESSQIAIASSLAGKKSHKRK
jgi:hypothetical protein